MLIKNCKSLATHFGLIWILVIGMFGSQPIKSVLAASYWYVSALGSDSNNCATTLTPCATINFAISQAADSDLIYVATGTYTDTGAEVVLINKSITLSGGWDAGFDTQSDKSTIDGQIIRRGITVNSSVTATVDHLIIQNGYFSEIYNGGGGIFNNGTLTVNNSIIKNNSTDEYAGGGGGIYNQANMTINNSTITNNVANGSSRGGGGIFNIGTMVLNGSTITGNTIDGSNHPSGAGIYNYSYYGSVTLNNSTVSNNNAGNHEGGGINNAFGTTTLNNSTISNNIALNGAGIDNNWMMAINNSTISFNKASYSVGGVYGNSDAGLTIQNTIIANNIGGTNPDCFGYVTSAGHNIIGIGNYTLGACRAISTSSDLFGTSSNPIDPRLTSLQDNGGPTFTHALLSDSPAIDAGDDVNCPATDQRGVARPQGSQCDIGAYEKIVRYVRWNAGGSNNGSSWTNAYADLQSALAAASSGDEIWVATGTYKPTTGMDRTISFVLKNDVAIYGGFAGTETLRTQRNPTTNVTILSGDIGVIGNSSDNSYHVIVGGGTNSTTVLDGFTTTRGNADGAYPYEWGGGIYILNGSPDLVNMVFAENNAKAGGGMYSDDYSSVSLTNVVFTNNSATNEGGGILNRGFLTIIDSTFSNNSASLANSGVGGGILSIFGTLNISNSTFTGNIATEGGGLNNNNANTANLVDVTFAGNSALVGAGINNHALLNLTNTTISDNTGMGGIYNAGTMNYINTIIANTYGSDCYNDLSGIIGVNISNLVEGHTDGFPDVNCGTPALSGDPKLIPLANNGGYTQTMALGGGSPAIDAGNDVNCPATDQRGVDRPQGSHCDIGAYEAGGIQVMVGSLEMGTYTLKSAESTRVSLTGINNGPVQIHNTNTGAMNLIAAERVIYKVNGTNTSFSELMALPYSQLTTTYWLPWYNSVDLDTQLRIGNVSGNPAQVHVIINGQEVTGSPFALSATGAGQSLRLSFPNINSGPVQIVADQNIVAAERVIYKVNGTSTSFSELMALPTSQLTTTYWLPWYNNVNLDTQLRIGNVSGTPAQVHVIINGQEVTGSPFALSANGTGQSLRLSFPNVNSGPVQIVADQNIVAAERVIYKVNGINTSFSELMALPDSQLTTTYWLPWYNNVDLDTQLRIGNVSGSTATVHIFIGGTEATPVSGLTLLTGASTRVSYPSVNSGPVQIVADQNIVAAERVIYKVNNVNTSFSELMALPDSQLDTTYWLPWYNNVDLDTQLRFGVP